MTNPSTRTNPLDYPRYVRGLRPALPDSLGQYVDDELEKLQNSMENLAVAADENTKAKVSVETIERETDIETLASQITTVQADFESELNDLSASITSEITARATADSAIASSITTLSSTVGANTAAITTEASTRASQINALDSRADAVEAKYAVKVSAGKVVGFELIASGSTSDFIVNADHFAVDSGGQRPFEIISGQVYIKNATIQNDAVTTPKIDDNAVTKRYYSTLGSNVSGSGGFTTVLSIPISLPYTADVIIQCSGSQNYTTGIPDWEARIQVDGGATPAGASGGAGAYVSSWALCHKATLSAGSHTISLRWRGGDSGIQLTAAGLVVDPAFR